MIFVAVLLPFPKRHFIDEQALERVSLSPPAIYILAKTTPNIRQIGGCFSCSAKTLS